MLRSQRLSAVQRIAEKKVEDAARALSAARARLEGQRQQLTQLCSYRDEYGASLPSGGMDIGRLTELRAFISRINQAIEQQQRQIGEAEREFARARDRWLGLRGREQALGKVVERAQGEELLASERQEQSASDERGNRRGSAD